MEDLEEQNSFGSFTRETISIIPRGLREASRMAHILMIKRK